MLQKKHKSKASPVSTTPTDRPKPTAKFNRNRLSVEKFPTRVEMGAAAAADIISHLKARLATQSKVRMIFAAAPSQAEMLAALVADGSIDWSRVTAFHMDEYIGLEPGSPARFARWLDANLFEMVRFDCVHRIDPGPAPELEARRYAVHLDEAAIDVVCLGIGVNGHIAFNDPPVADFDDPFDVKIVDLDEVCRQQQVDDGCFPDLGSVPQQAITLTVPRLLRAGRLFCVVPGEVKRTAVSRTLHGPIDTACPASILKTHSACTLYVDEASCPDD
ncbi:Glucosamine/galactosamine-6-phosphate isomerase [Pseudorhizobium banfieldiae]|uniref:Glucosamine/galactosamine-6-phosphate isomerase n=1 Tax=Pseudorhizobium banfieldiae TaxID=1125847 RepID=L0NIR5_9HYPH|nr:glucosamine-6-phosphate deaminase [arsenite-oxidising bacterium NT-25]CCF20774.1 Glucosamine/galactosamine-6-phosphate isomerase [Pseudorhizobium banfieldiae]